MCIKFEKGINKGNIAFLCQWSNELGPAFQEQWMGSQVPYPLTYDKIEKLENTFSIFHEEEFIGMIQEIRVEEDSIHIGRFLLNPKKTGLGFGTEALKEFMNLIFKDEKMKSISLTVFDYNQKAKRVYDKLGFEVDEVVEIPKRKYIMRKHR